MCPLLSILLLLLLLLLLLCRESLIHILEPGETMFYTWERPNEHRVLRWGLAGFRIKDPKPIYLDKVSIYTLSIQSATNPLL